MPNIHCENYTHANHHASHSFLHVYTSMKKSDAVFTRHRLFMFL